MYHHARMKRAAQRSADRREQEDAADRLHEVVPKLETLQLNIEQGFGQTGLEPGYVRHIIVATAPALFLIPCGNKTCALGRHDITEEVLTALKEQKESFEGNRVCDGDAEGSACGRSLRYTATATYGK